MAVGKEKVRIIGLVLEDIFTDFAKEIISSVKRALPQNNSLRLAVITGKFYDGTDTDDDTRWYKKVYNTIYSLAAMCDLAGLIIHPGSMAENRLNMLETGVLGSLHGTPVVLISCDIPGYTTVSYDNSKGIREALEFIINVNGITNLCMLGGRDDNLEARLRKQIFVKCLRENGIMFREKMYEKTDMSVETEEAAGRLIDRNPGVNAIFCVNDGSAVGLYKAMKKRRLVPGKDILVFGFDNTHMSGEMKPSLASVGPESATLGQKAIELLLAKINGEEVSSVQIPTKLYGRESFPFEMNEFSDKDIISMDAGFIYRLFDDCFYRYKRDLIGREAIDMRRLFFEIISRMLKGMNNRYVSTEDFEEIGRLIDIFFDSGAMEYTDSSKLLSCINRLQNSMIVVQKRSSVNANVFINRLFLRMKDKAIHTLSDKIIMDSRDSGESSEAIKNFLIRSVTVDPDAEDSRKKLIKNLSGLGFRNGALYLFDKPVTYDENNMMPYPERIDLWCAFKNGELHPLPQERRSGLTGDIFLRDELNSRRSGYAAFPIFFRKKIYGILLNELNSSEFERDEVIAILLGRAIFLSE